MNRFYLILSTAVIAIILAGSSKDNNDKKQTPIRLSSGIEAQSRAFDSMNTQFPAGRSVAFYVDNAATSEQIYGNNVLTTDGSNGFTVGTNIFFPETGENISIYATHTNAALATAFPTAAITHTVAADQTTGADHYNSHLLYSVKKGVASTNSDVQLNFYHMLSKVRIAIAPGENSPDLTDATVQILGTQWSLKLIPSKSVDITRQPDRAAMMTPMGSRVLITVTNEISADFTAPNVKYNDAIVVPQTTKSGEAFIRVTLSDGTELEWAPDPITLESGRCYSYNVYVSRTGLNVSTTVADWEYEHGNPELQTESNSYMVLPHGKAIHIPISRANKAADSRYNLGASTTGLGGVTPDNYTVELVWGDTPVGEGGVIREMRPDGNYIYLKSGIPGNAVICIKVGSVIKWSWHIWVTYPVGYGVDLETGLTWMDRNLGAGVTGYYQSEGKKGIFYQWGRKDAFPGSVGLWSSIQMYYTQSGGDTPTNVNLEGYYKEIPDMVHNPLSFAHALGYYKVSLNVKNEENDSWGSIGYKDHLRPLPSGMEGGHRLIITEQIRVGAVGRIGVISQITAGYSKAPLSIIFILLQGSGPTAAVMLFFASVKMSFTGQLMPPLLKRV